MDRKAAKELLQTQAWFDRGGDPRARQETYLVTFYRKPVTRSS